MPWITMFTFKTDLENPVMQMLALKIHKFLAIFFFLYIGTYIFRDSYEFQKISNFLRFHEKCIIHNTS